MFEWVQIMDWSQWDYPKPMASRLLFAQVLQSKKIRFAKGYRNVHKLHGLQKRQWSWQHHQSKYITPYYSKIILKCLSRIINSLWNQRLLKVIQEGIAESIRLEDQFILRDQDMSSQMEFGLFAHKKNYGNLIINHMRFFRSKSLWRAHMFSRNKFSILFRFWIWLILVFPQWVKKCVD
jgi:hypothetical protein